MLQCKLKTGGDLVSHQGKFDLGPLLFCQGLAERGTDPPPKPNYFSKGIHPFMNL